MLFTALWCWEPVSIGGFSTVFQRSLLWGGLGIKGKALMQDKRQFEKLKVDSMKIERENEELKKRKIALSRREDSVKHEKGLIRT